MQPQNISQQSNEASYNQSTQIQQTYQFKMKWLCIGAVQHKNEKYQYVYRPTTKQKNLNLQKDNKSINQIHPKKGIDGIQIIPIIEYKDRKQLIFIANFRPAVGKFVLQFPAGLAQGQNLQQNANRQLEQQTGLIASKFILHPQPVIYADPSKGNQSGVYFIALINGQDPKSFVEYKRQNTENIRCYGLKYCHERYVCDELERFMKKEGYICDAKTWSVCMGIDLKERMRKEGINIF